MRELDCVNAETSRIGELEFDTGTLSSVLANRDNVVFEEAEMKAYVDSGHEFMQTSNDPGAIEKVYEDFKAAGVQIREPELSSNYEALNIV